MELTSLTALTWSIVYVFIFSLTKEISSTSQTVFPNHLTSQDEPVDLSEKNSLRAENAKFLKHLENHQYLEGEDIPIGLKTYQFAHIWNGNGLESKQEPVLTKWGKGSLELDDVQPNYLENANSGLRNKKNWSRFSSWGKKSGPNNQFEGDTEKRWKEMSVWGKRDNIENEHELLQPEMDKKWKGMKMWGKRQSVDPGKKWRSISAWGKRDFDTEVDNKWKDMSAVDNQEDTKLDRMWENAGVIRKLKDASASKRWKEMAVWGKRSSEPSESGRVDNLELREQPTLKPSRNWRNKEMWGKRPSWSNTGFNSWGKRSSSSTFDPFYGYHHQDHALIDSQDQQD